MRLAVSGNRVLTPGGEIEPATVVVDTESGLIVEFVRGGEGHAAANVRVEVGDRLLSPGFVDVHVHGGGGAEVHGDDPAEIERIALGVARFHVVRGTTSMVATTVADSHRRLLATVAGLAAAVRASVRPEHVGSRILGTHLEGPWIAPARRGAHEPASLRPPSRRELEELIGAADGTLRLVTIAPELPGAIEQIEAALAAGIAASLGHSEASYEEAQRGFDAGASHVTHLFNAMSPMHHRKPGLVGAALARSGVTIELIADGEHVHPAVLGIVGALAPERVVAVTDAIGATGLPPGRHVLGTLEIVVEDTPAGGRVFLADHPETLAGSVLTMDRAVRSLGAAGMPLAAALGAATSTPAIAIGRRDLGVIAPGAVADLVLLGPDLTVDATLVAGRAVHDPGAIFA